MIEWAVYAMVYAGAALMVYNIYGFIRFARYVKGLESWSSKSGILYIPIILLAMFLVGYLVVGIFGKPDLVIAGILFFGSVFVFIMYKYLGNITQRIVENEQREMELKAAEEASKAKASFLASISHEMRTPLNVILGMDGIALRNPDLTPDVRDHLEKINLSARHLLGLINNILDMNRNADGMFTIENKEFALAGTVNQIDAIAGALCVEKGLAYEMAGAQYEDLCFIGDEMQLKRVLLSIVDNAVKYTDAPGTVKFSVECTPKDDAIYAIRFEIADTGVGMSEDFAAKVFNAFAQEDASATTRYGGGGLSLAVAKNIIGLMGGTIEAQSKKGEGSTFIVEVPLVCTGTRQTDAKSDEPESEISLEGVRILIVEDVTENAEIVADLLELEGAETEHAENGQIAVDMVSQSADSYYDAILMDLRMPVMDGLEATRRIRAMDRAYAQTVPIIALTANAFDEDVRQSLEAGMDVHLAKPVAADTLYDVIRQQIGKTSVRAGDEKL